MNTTQTAPHFETLTRALGDKVGKEIDREELRAEFEKYLEYGVPADQAVKTILRHHGVTGGMAPAAPASQERVPLRDVPPNVPYVNLLVRFVTLNRKTVQARGEQKEIFWGLVGDETGTRSFTSWRPLEGLERGDVVAVQGAYTKEFRGEVQINFGDRCRIDKRGADELPRTPVESTDATVGSLKDGMRGVRVTARVLDVQSRQVTVQGAPKTVHGGTLADTTGKVEFTDWHGHGLKAGDVVTIEGAYVRAYRGAPQLSFDQEAVVRPAQVQLPPAAELDRASRIRLGTLVERGGGNDVAAVGTLLEVRQGSGLVFRCTTEGCSRVLVAAQCRLHGKSEGTPDLRIKGVLDDGTGAVSIVAGREITEALLGKTLDQCLQEAKEAFRPEVVHEQLRTKLEGRVYEARGNVLADEFGLMFIVRHLAPFREDTGKAAEDLLAELPPEAF